MSKLIEVDQQLAHITNDRYRLRYHLMPPGGWMNDPNGLIFYRGEFHAFYQHYPYEPYQGPMHWGHAKSEDLIHWEHLPIALMPSESYDLGEQSGYGCWSGSAVDDDGVLSLLYTGHVDGRSPVEVQCLARSVDGLTFEKYVNNPIIDAPPHEQCFGFRDPKVWKHNDMYYMLVGYGNDGVGKTLMYKSIELIHWEYVGVPAQSDGMMGDMWECPDMFQLGDVADDHVLIFSPMNIAPVKTMYWSGQFDYENVVFNRSHVDRIDYGFDFYAPQTLIDDKGRRIMFGWMNIWGATMPEREDGWMGALTLPRELKLADDGTLRCVPVDELTRLRGNHHQLKAEVLKADQLLNLSTIQGDALEIIVVFDMKDAAVDVKFGIRVRSALDDSQYTEIAYDTANSRLLMNRELAGTGDGGVSEAPLTMMDNGQVKLHIYVDRSSVELFANDGVRTITNRIYPDPANISVKLFSNNADVRLQSLDVWELTDVTAIMAAKSGK